MAAPGWLTARPFAHRGLHDTAKAPPGNPNGDAASGIVENTPSAFAAAIAGGYGIECDLRLSADGEVMVFHDATLERLTESRGALAGKTAAALRNIPFKRTSDRMLSLPELCDMVGGRVPLLLELKSDFDASLALPAALSRIVRSYSGPAAAMSFDPHQVAALRALAPSLPRGIVAERRYDHVEWAGLPAAARFCLPYLLHAPRTRPHFVAYAIDDLPAFAPLIARRLFGLPLLVWTVRTPAQQACARRWADQMIFEGFRP
jgi:glycerophosphoryl diester phosphodiesterase